MEEQILDKEEIKDEDFKKEKAESSKKTFSKMKIGGEESGRAGKNLLFIAKASIYLLIFLLPLFFLPWTNNILQLNKQALLLFLVFIGLICFFAASLTSNRLKINTGLFNLAVAGFVLSLIVSTAVSLYRQGSFWGLPLSVSSSFISLAAFALFYFLVANLFKKEEIPSLLITLLFSGFFAALFFLFQVFGKFILPFDFAKDISFNTIGAVNALGLYLAVLLILLLPLLLFVKKPLKIILSIIGPVFLVCLFFIDFRYAWLAFLAGLIILFAFGVVNLRRTGRSGFVTLVMVLLVIASLFLFFRFSFVWKPKLPVEVYPKQQTCFHIAKSMPLKQIFFGSGPGTFAYDWSQYKPLDINKTNFWAVRFGRSASEVWERIITTGLLGFLALLGIFAVFFKIVLSLLRQEAKGGKGAGPRLEALERFLIWEILAGLAGVAAVFFFYPGNHSIWLLFWLLIGIAAILKTEKQKTFELGASSIGSLAFSFVFVVVFVLGIGLFILYGQKYMADVRYQQSLTSWFVEGDLEKSIQQMNKAAALNPYNGLYLRNLSQLYLAYLNQTIKDNNIPSAQKTEKARQLVSLSINSANQAARFEPNNVANWSVRGFVYRSMFGILGGAEDWAIKSYKKAAELEPANPYLYTELGLSYLNKADQQKNQKKEQEAKENLNLAKEAFEKAVAVKPDYAPANFQIAMIYVREGENKQAISTLEKVQQSAPSDIGVAFQLGLLYYNSDEMDKAQAEFERAVLLDPNYSNARYFLGLIYDKKGDKKAAIEQFEKIEKFNPDNKEVKTILANLREGKPALEGVAPGQPPIQEKAPEQLEKSQ